MNNENITTYFAVTDQWSIIPLVEINRENGEGFIFIETEIQGEVEYPEHCECHHKIYFKELYLNSEGKPDKSNVFTSLQEAKAWAIKCINTDIAVKQRVVNQLKATLKRLIT